LNMPILLFLLGIFVMVMVAGNFKQTRGVNRYLKRKLKYQNRIPEVISMLILAAQAGELVRVVRDASLINISAALFIFMIVLATKSGTEKGTEP